MEEIKLKKLSVSNLVLIILNDNYDKYLRKFAEVELRRRIRNVSMDYDEFLHYDDKVIQKRGLDIDNYLISPNVNMQQLMEAFFTYNRSNELLFSEKHLCNDVAFAEPFFRKICSREIKNLERRIDGSDIKSQIELLLSIQNMLIERKQISRTILKTIIKEPDEYLGMGFMFSNDAYDHFSCLWHNYLTNISDEEAYDLYCSKLGRLKIAILDFIEDRFFEDPLQYLSGMKFVIKDSLKLSEQKRQLLSQVKSGYEVDYQNPTMQRALKMIKESKK